MEVFLTYLKVFAVGGALCALGQLLINKTKMSSARILVTFMLLGLVLEIAGGVFIYERICVRGCYHPDYGIRQQPCERRAGRGERGRRARRGKRRTESRGTRTFGGHTFRFRICTDFQVAEQKSVAENIVFNVRLQEFTRASNAKQRLRMTAYCCKLKMPFMAFLFYLF